MATDTAMGIEERYQYLRRMQKRYQKADRREQSALLDEMVAYTGLHRKSLIRRLRSDLTRRPRSRERGRTYGPDVDAALLKLWEATDYVCAERLQPVVVDMGKLLAQHGELRLGPQLETQLGQMSVSTIRRHLPPAPQTHRPRRSKAPQNRYQRDVPAYRIPRDVADPGHLELDLVHHCGEATVGEYVHSLQLVDVATGWSVRRAILGRSRLVVVDALAFLLPQLPFPLRELHPDNGSEFLNQMLADFLVQDYPDCLLSRSRSATPNDNRLVEQKNSSLIRHYLGDRRLDSVAQTHALNALYARMQPFHNLVQPVMKQIAKAWVPATDDRPGYVRRRHDTPRPPLQRLCDILGHDHVTPQVLFQRRDDINPLELRRAIYQDRDHIFTLPGAQLGQTENVFATLACPDRFPAAVAALQAVDTVDKPQTGLTTVSTASTTTDLSQNRKEEATSR